MNSTQHIKYNMNSNDTCINDDQLINLNFRMRRFLKIENVHCKACDKAISITNLKHFITPRHISRREYYFSLLNLNNERQERETMEQEDINIKPSKPCDVCFDEDKLLFKHDNCNFSMCLNCITAIADDEKYKCPYCRKIETVKVNHINETSDEYDELESKYYYMEEQYETLNAEVIKLRDENYEALSNYNWMECEKEELEEENEKLQKANVELLLEVELYKKNIELYKKNVEIYKENNNSLIINLK